MNKEIEERNNYATLGERYIENAESTYDVLNNAYYENTLDIEKFKASFKYVERSCTHDRFCFDLINIDPPLANALRRIMLDEVPVMAPDTIVFHDNTSIIPDEVLAHRIGLCPIDVNPHLFEFRADAAVSSPITENNTLIFKLDVTAPSIAEASKSAKETGETLWYNVYAGDMQWVPIGTQPDAEPFIAHPVRFLYPDILLAKLAPGQSIKAEIYCHKGTGRQHAKWSPVGTAFYSMHPQVTVQGINDKITLECPRSREVKVDSLDLEDETLHSGVISMTDFFNELKATCPKACFNKIKVDKLAKKKVLSSQDIEDINAVIDSDKCSLCRECYYKFPKNVKVQLNKKHFRFTVESVSYLSSKQIFLDALEILSQKAQEIIEGVKITENEPEIITNENEKETNVESETKDTSNLSNESEELQDEPNIDCDLSEEEEN